MHFDKELHYIGDADLKYYKQQAETIDYPNVCTTTPQEVTASTEPRTLRDRRKDEIWDLSLAEAIQIALANNRIIRLRSQFQPGALAVNATSTSVYDPAIQESSVLFGNRGVEAALADFDANFATSMIWGRDERIQNNAFAGLGLTPGNTLTQETGLFESSLSKNFGYGGQLTFAHDWNYLGSNAPAQLFPSSYTGNVRAEYRQPLWAGAGPEFTRIAGPLNPNFSGITGVSQGVVIARINNDITLADFEERVREMVKDIEDLYWELYLNYQIYRTLVVARNSALKTWRDAEITDREGGIEGFDKADVPQARDQYFARKADAEIALNNIYSRETELRRLLGLPVADGRIIRPSDEPSRAEFIPDWYVSLTEALAGRVELRRQKWQIKSLELQYQAAQSLTNPQLDFVSSYRVNGFGDKLLDYGDNDGVTAQGLNSAYETLTQGNQTGWNLGFVFSMPLGFRSANAQVRNYELRLAKSRAVLATLELDVAHSLSQSFQGIAANYAAAESNLNRQIAAQERVDILEKQREGGVLKADLVLRAQSSRAEAEASFFRSLVLYTQSITDFHFRKGTILENNNISLSESMWTPAAYRDALRRAWARSHAIDNPTLDTAPGEFVLPGKYAMQLTKDGAVPPEPALEPQPTSDGTKGTMTQPFDPSIVAPVPAGGTIPQALPPDMGKGFSDAGNVYKFPGKSRESLAEALMPAQRKMSKSAYFESAEPAAGATETLEVPDDDESERR